MNYPGLSLAPSLRDIAIAFNRLLIGKMNVGTSLTLAASATTTPLADPRIGPNSIILLTPRTANAAGALATTYVSAKGKQTATITHASTASIDRTFDVAIVG